MKTIEENEDGTVGIVETDGDFDEWEPVSVKTELLEEFIEKCQEMGFEKVTLYARDDNPLLAHEAGDDFGVYVALAPLVTKCGDCGAEYEGLLKCEMEDGTIERLCPDCVYENDDDISEVIGDEEADDG